MRKEVRTRLLLTLLTAFVMVAGVFGAALQSFNIDQIGEEPSQPIDGEPAASELDEELRETGEAPVSAFALNSDSAFNGETLDIFETVDGNPTGPIIVTEDMARDRAPEEELIKEPIEVTPSPRVEDTGEVIEDHGTRTTIYLDPGGPYGTPDDPEYEGMTLPFEAHVYDTDEDPPDDISDNYQFRWSFKDDGDYTPWSTPPGATTFPYKYTDDYIGKARVQAWDGTTVSVWSDLAAVQDEPTWEYLIWTYYPDDYVTMGWSFDVNADVQVEELALYRGWTYLWTDCEAIRIWDTSTQAVVGELIEPSPLPSQLSWRWYTLSTPIDLEAGKEYIIGGVYYYDGGAWPEVFWAPDPTPDGVIEPGSLYDNAGTAPGYPDNFLANGLCNGVDFRYKYLMEDIPVVEEALADVFVWNKNPTAFGASVTPDEHVEGAGGEEFTAWLTDPGEDDEWFFKWVWGDGTETDWIPVPVWSGGIKVLVCHAYSTFIDDIMDDLAAALGPHAVVLDEFDFGPLGAGAPPSLSQMLDYDVVLVGVRWGPIPSAAMGDRMVEYTQAGGGIVQMGGSFMNTPTWGIMGDWTAQNYNPIAYASSESTWRNLGNIYEPDHEMIDGFFGEVDEISVGWKHMTSNVGMFATLLADYDNGYVLAAYLDENDHPDGNARIAGLNMWAHGYQHTGDDWVLIANTLMWASAGTGATKLIPPLQTPAVDHVFGDDHPTTLTPTDVFHPEVFIKDDDHCQDVMIGDVLEYTMDFNMAWGTYGNNPPPGWEIIDLAPVPSVWEYGTPTFGPSGAHSGSYCWGTDLDYYYNYNNLHTWIESPAIDLSGYTGATLKFWMWYRTENNYDWVKIQASNDDNAWIQLDAFTGTGGASWTEYEYDIHMFAGSSNVKIRFMLTSDTSVYTYQGAYIDDVEIYGYTGGSLGTIFLTEGFEGSWMPSGWTQVQYEGEGEWIQEPYPDNYYDPAGGGLYMAQADDYDIEDDYDTGLFTPAMDLTGEDEVILGWQWSFFYGYYGDECAVNTYSGGTAPANFEEELWDRQFYMYPYWGGHWTEEEFDPSDYDDPSEVYIEFWYTDGGSPYAWFFSIDDVIVYTEGAEGTEESTPTYSEDFEADDGDYTTGTTPNPWDYNDWHRVQYSTWMGTARILNSPYELQDDWLISPVFDLTTGFTEASMEFDIPYNYNYYGNAEVHLKYELDGTGTWTTLQTWDSSGAAGHYIYDLNGAVGHTVRVAYHAESPLASYQGYHYMYVDNFYIVGIPELRHVIGISDPVQVTKTIHNVFPSVASSPGFIDEILESESTELVDFKITDPALGRATENFAYRVDLDDGQGPGPWDIREIQAATEFNVLVIHTLEMAGNTGPDITPFINAVYASTPMVVNVDAWNLFEAPPYGSRPQPEAPPYSVLEQYNIIMITMNWVWIGGANLQPWIDAKRQLGNDLADYLDNLVGGVVSQFGTYETNQPGEPGWGLLGRFIEEDYGPFEKLQFTWIPTSSLGTIHEPGHEVMQGVNTIGSTYVHSGDEPLTQDAVLLADWPDGNSAIGCKAGPTGGKVVHIGMTGIGLTGDTERLFANAMKWVTTVFNPKIDPISLTYMDNGIYNIDIQVIDDDMWWDLSGTTPIFLGPNRDANNPGADPNDWIGGRIFPIKVANTDPTVSPITAEISLDLAIRVTGEPDNPTTMALYKDGTKLNEVTIEHDGNQQIAVMPATLDMGAINDYYIEVTYVGSGGGANPTWIFQGRFGSGHIKELKRVFKDGMDPWTIGPEYLKQMIVGEDITFYAGGDDPGSDDLAFLWNFGDGSAHGINVYANKAPTVAVPGVSGPAPDIFDVAPNRDPAFTKAANDVRSPSGRSMHADEMETHAFEKGYYYFVCLILMDDDVGDGYASYQNFLAMNGGGYDVDFIEIDLA